MLNAIAQRGGGAQAGAKSRVMRILDVLSTLSALGGLSSLVNTVKKCARYAITWLRRPQPMHGPRDAPNTMIATDQYVSGNAPQGTRRCTSAMP